MLSERCYILRMHPPRMLQVTTPAQWRLFRSAAKSRVLRAFLDQKPRSVANAAKWLGQPPQSVYPHVEALAAASILERVKGPGIACYAFRYEGVSFESVGTNEASSTAWNEIIRGAFRAAERVYTDRNARGPARLSARHSLTSEEALLSAEEANEFARELAALRKRFHGATVRNLTREPTAETVRVNLLLGMTDIEDGSSPARRTPKS